MATPVLSVILLFNIFVRMRLLITILFLIPAWIASGQPAGYYDNATGLVGDELKEALHNIIDNHTEYSYDDLRDFILENTDEDPNNPNNIILLYTGRSQNKNTFGGGADDWNREHVWAKSHGDFGNSPPCGTDAHHIRPTDASVNSARGNKDFDNGGQQHPEATGCYYDDDSWEPRDEVKGDVARMIFYMSVRYEGGNGEPDLEVVDWVNTAPAPEHGKFSTLYEWHQQDPPDDFEMNRNEVIYSYQGNRNPFIDHPEFLILIYDPTNAVHDVYHRKLNMYPNPAKRFVNLILNNEPETNSKINVRNQMGQLVLKDEIKAGEIIKEIDITGLKSGIYFITLETGKEVLTTKLNVRR